MGDWFSVKLNGREVRNPVAKWTIAIAILIAMVALLFIVPVFMIVGAVYVVKTFVGTGNALILSVLIVDLLTITHLTLRLTGRRGFYRFYPDAKGTNVHEVNFADAFKQVPK